MYDRFIVCHVRTVLDLKKDEVALSVPSSAIVTRTMWWRRMPVGWSWRACVRRVGTMGRQQRRRILKRVRGHLRGRAAAAPDNAAQNTGMQLLLKILQ